MHKLKNIILLAGLLTALTTAQGQNVVDISSRNTFKNGSVYFINEPLPITLTRLIIKDPSGIIPRSTLGHLNIPLPAATQSYFKLKDGTPKGEFILEKHDYGSSTKPVDDSRADKILISYTESVGSGCCPRDPAVDIYGRLAKFNSDFEHQHKVKLGKVYIYTYGDEGESTFYYTLSGLTPQLKAQFINGRTQLLNTVRNPGHPLTPWVYFPSWIVKEKFVREAF